VIPSQQVCQLINPVFSTPAVEAGESIATDTMKCQLKPVSFADYTVSFTTDQITRLLRIFPNGVCDWSKLGVNFTNVVPWPSFGPSPDNLIFDVTHP